MAESFRSTSRYRLVDLQTGQVVIVFQAYARMSPMDSCQMACGEFKITPVSGPYRLECLVRNATTGTLRWSHRNSFVLDVES